MPKATTKFNFPLDALKTPEKLADILVLFAQFIDDNYARIETSIPLYEINVGSVTINLNPATRRIVIALKTTGVATLTLNDPTNNPCSVGTLVELKALRGGSLTVILGSLNNTTAGTGSSSLYYFKGTSGWIKLN